MLTDEEITLIVRECAKGSAINRDGSTSHRIARAVIAACEAKLREQEPIAKFDWSQGKFVWLTKCNYRLHDNQPLYLRPAPSAPEGMVLVPIEPTAAMAAAGWDDAIEHEADNIDIYDIAGIYRAMLNAAKDTK